MFKGCGSNKMRNFSSAKYKERALSRRDIPSGASRSKIDAFFLLIKGQDQETLSNLCETVKDFYYGAEGQNNKRIELTEEEAYMLTQGESVAGKVTLDENNRRAIYDAAYNCLLSGKNLGNKRTPDGRFNCSGWIGHSLLEAKLAGQLAFLSRLDTNKATKLRNAS